MSAARHRHPSPRRASIALAILLLTHPWAHAQGTEPAATPSTSPAVTSPATGAEPARGRDLFATTLLNLVAQGIGGAFADTLSGTIKGWFGQQATPARPAEAGAAAQSSAGPRAAPPSTASSHPTGVAALSAAAVPATGAVAGTGAKPPAGAAAVMGGKSTTSAIGSPAAGSRPPATLPATAEAGRPPAGPLAAGLAYEIHLVTPDGSTRQVDPVRHQFRTGDTFQVFYRPALPGLVDVRNIAPGGQHSRIERVRVAAGQLATLGPYRFIDRPGLETLTLVLEPCSSPAMTAVTRTIVKANQPVANSATSPIANCRGAYGPGRDLVTRQLIVTARPGRAAYAMDPLTPAESASGVVAPRSLQIQLRHG